MTPTEILAKLATWTEQHGGQLRETTPQEWGQAAKAPFSLGWAVLWHKKTALYRDIESSDEAAAGIHELGHILACLTHPDDNATMEIDFLGWEYSIAMELGIVEPWLLSMRDYGVNCPGGFNNFGDYSKSEQRNILAEHLRIAKKSGLIRYGRAIAIR